MTLHCEHYKRNTGLHLLGTFPIDKKCNFKKSSLVLKIYLQKSLSKICYLFIYSTVTKFQTDTVDFHSVWSIVTSWEAGCYMLV